ncbi:dethiobiotin synthase [Brachyspira suanatina]|uniref:Dethiobiotin synthase n=1 Tax=Brachyspira suanatina TaxID=381802 RepID=A0A0G4K8Z4_9SPIR|nr:AAA family ATPase [Brachyspira suanatina]CRF34112.1 dethiobiotin synthase [Brachyspira suanatina]
MKLFCIISDKSHVGKTYISSHIVSSLKMLDKTVCYYKPFVMEVRDNKLFDPEYVKKTTSLKASEIFVSYATNGNISPLHSINAKIDERDITDLIDENNNIYDYMVFESLSLYSPIKENYNFMDLMLDIEKENEIHIIPIIEYDSNVIHSSLEQVELFHTRGFKIPFIIINVRKDVFVSANVIKYITSQIDPIKVHITEFDKEAGISKINDIKYPNIIKDLF